MPRQRRAKNKAVIASGRMVDISKDGARYQTKAENWQELCWGFYDTIPEYHYAVTWVGNIVSRARLQICDEGHNVITTGDAVDALDELFGGADYHAEMLRQIAIHLTVAGDCYVVAVKKGNRDKWSIRTPSDISNDGANWRVGNETIPVSQALVIRVWKPHPRKPSMADSPSRAVLPILSEIDALTKHVSAQVDSRLAGAGILFIPDSIDFSQQQTQTSKDDDGDTSVTASVDSVQSFADEITDVASTAIRNRESAAALSPIVAQVSGDEIKAIRHITFWTPLEAQAMQLRQEAIGRLALGMDMPPEILTGTGDMNHWSSWQLEEAAIKAHTEPFLSVITSSLTEGYLTPVLEAEGSAQADEVMIDADTSELRLRPNRSQEALELNDRGIVSDEATARENGFDQADLMSPEEQTEWLNRKLILQGSPTPEMMIQALRSLGVDMPDTAAAQETITDNETPEAKPPARQAPSLDDHPDNSPPDTQDAAAAASLMVYRALERAGNKLRNSRAISRDTQGIDAAQVYLKVDYAPDIVPALLDGAWNSIPELELSVPPQKLAVWMQRYTTQLLIQKKPFVPQQVGEYIRSEMALAGLDVAG